MKLSDSEGVVILVSKLTVLVDNNATYIVVRAELVYKGGLEEALTLCNIECFMPFPLSFTNTYAQNCIQTYVLVYECKQTKPLIVIVYSTLIMS